MGSMTPTYHAYLLRIWRENGCEAWRALLEDPHTGERLGFDGADRLLAYLTAQLTTKPPPTSEAEGTATSPSTPD